MAKTNNLQIALFAIAAILIIVLSIHFALQARESSASGALLASFPGKSASASGANFPVEVLNAIRAGQDVVEVPLSNEITRVFFIDYSTSSPITGGGTDCGTDSNSYKFLRKGVKWKSFPVTYSIDTTNLAGVDAATGKQAVVNGFNAWDAEEQPLGAFYTESATSPKIFVHWAPIDGPSGTLAVTSTTFYTTTGEIIHADTTFDSGDSWAVFPSLSCTSQGTAFDIQDIATHELGHANGLDHVRKLADKALTMYPYANTGETLKRTLGTGDKLGLKALYP